MMRTAASLLTFAVALLAVPALAEDSLPPNPMFHKVPVPIFSFDREAVSRASCRDDVAANVAQADVNPISGERQPEPILSIPLTGGSGGIAAATEREEEAFLCGSERP